MLNAQLAKVYFSEFAINTCELKNSSNCFGKLKVDDNLVVKSEVSPRSGTVALRQLNPIHEKGA